MDKKILFYAGVIILILYLISPVPYCVLGDGEDLQNSETKSASELLNLKDGEEILLHVLGNSMYPIIRNDSRCLCEKSENYEIGDIVVFFTGEDVIGHRIIGIIGEEILTKGDYNNFVDNSIEEEQVVCKIPEVPRFRVLFLGVR